MSPDEQGDAGDPATDEVWELVAQSGIRMLRIPTPFQVGRVNCYLIETEPLTLIDTGPKSGKALEELEHQLGAHGYEIEDLDLVIISHHHLDHFGLVDVVAGRSGAEVAAIDVALPYIENFAENAEADDRAAMELMRRHGISEEVVGALQQVSASFRSWGESTKVTRPLHDGETIALGDRELEVQYRPGHSLSDTVFWDSDRRVLAAADHLIKHISSNALISRPLDGTGEQPQALVNYIRSLQRTRELPADVVLAGHGEPIGVGTHRELIEGRLRLHQRRAEKLYGLIAEQPRTGHELAQVIWGNVAVTQAFLTLSEVIGHVDLLINAGLAHEVDDGDLTRYEASSDLAAKELGDLLPGAGNR